MTQNSPTPTLPNQPQPNNQPVVATQTVTPLPEAPAAWNTFAVDADGFEEQFTLRAATARELMAHVREMKNYLKQKGYHPVARHARVGSGAGQASDTASATEQAPMCAIHHEPMARRTGSGRKPAPPHLSNQNLIVNVRDLNQSQRETLIRIVNEWLAQQKNER